jgi:O-antigen/teichoic acid export membrane protein
MPKLINLRSTFGRNVITLIMGTGIAQAIPVAVSPILTRVYSPNQFGTLTLFISIFAIVSAIATMRYELAIVQPEKDEDAAALLVLSLLISLSVGVVLTLSVLLFGDEFTRWMGVRGGAWLYFIPLSVVVGGAVQAMGYWHSRRQQFSRLSQSKVAQGVGTATVQCASGVASSATGLVAGYVVGQCVSLWTLCRGVWRRDRALLQSVDRESIGRNARRYRNFPRYSAVGALADNASLQMPVLMLTRFFDAKATGSFGLTFRVLNLPMSLVASALSQVLYQKLASMQHDTPAAVRGLILRIFLILLGAMVPVVLMVSLFGEPLFALVFGEPWRAAGRMAGLLVFAVAIRFAVSPLSSVLALNHNVRLGALWQMIYLVTISTTLYVFSHGPLDHFLKAFVVHEMVLYSLYLTFILRGAKLTSAR